MRVRPAIWLVYSLLLTLSTIAIAQDSQPPQKPLAQPLAKLELAAGDSIVFLGDSITHQCLYTQYVEDYFYTRFPKMRLKIHNAGVGGAVAWDALQRFDEDVAAYKPKYVTILLGMNDGRYSPYNDEVFQTYRRDMTELITRLKAIDATPIPMTPTMFDARACRVGKWKLGGPDSIQLYNSVLAYYGTWLRDVAVQQGLGFVDMWSPLNNITLEQRKTDAAFTMIPDAVHPGPAGQVVMATAMIEGLGLPRKVSNIRINTRGKAENQANVSGGVLSELSVSDDMIEFTWLAEALPWVVPEEAQQGAELTHLGHKFSQETLSVSGMTPGRYELTIDDQNVGVFGSWALARRVELEMNAKTPQYQQALAVAELNKQRNTGPVRSLRNEWGQFQQFARVRRAAEASPDNEELKKQLVALQAKIEGQPERVAQVNREAQEIEDKIFQANQPKPRRYALKRVPSGGQ